MRQCLIGLCWLGIILTLSCPGFSEEKDYADFKSIEELIDYETAMISNSSGSEALSDAHLSRGESYLISEEYAKALEDLQKGYAIATLLPNESKYPALLRSLFAQTFAFANIDMMENMQACADEMNRILDSYHCSDCSENSLAKTHKSMRHDEVLSLQKKTDTNLITLLASDQIIGEDEISIGECVQRAQNTATLARALIVKSRVAVQFALQMIIDPLERSAISCCRAGGIWKACLQPLVSKWVQWNRKWDAFRIPPDPSWD